MRGFATSPNPYTIGLRPRRFLQARLEMLRREQILGTKVVKEVKPSKAA
jgi:hypothetical protein